MICVVFGSLIREYEEGHSIHNLVRAVIWNSETLSACAQADKRVCVSVLPGKMPMVGDECPVCMEIYAEGCGLAHGPSNVGDWHGVKCTHYLCTDCWRASKEMADLKKVCPRCPLCREDVRQWMNGDAIFFDSDSDEDGDEDS